jgi:hypothetical protein
MIPNIEAVEKRLCEYVSEMVAIWSIVSFEFQDVCGLVGK